MSDDLHGKTALVTGAAKRIGAAISLALAREGANVILHYRGSADQAERLRDEIVALGVRSWLVRADFEKPQEYETLVERSIEAAGGLDMLVNNASFFPADSLSTIRFEDLVRSMEVNAWVPFVLSRDFARLAGRGKIVNLVDSRTHDFDWAHVGYILSKHVLDVLTRVTALKYAPNITVNGVAPGLILPPPGEDESYLQRLTHTVPLKRHGSPEDIAETVVYLMKSDFVTGEIIAVDGGRRLKEYESGPRPDK
ncbi:MAG TPA: SDR family oxidoreductase [Dehalococcoidia bacterium]|nr:SDR family oxidoreductase [Dehalococcoidia bacterium]